MKTAKLKKPGIKKTRSLRKPTVKKQVSAQVHPHTFTDSGTKVLILRRCNKDGTSYGGFQWPESGPVEAKDFIRGKDCGDGLHGWAWGMAMGEGADYSIIDDLWKVFACDPKDVVGNVGGGQKCKAKCGEVIYSGVYAGAWAVINGGRHRLIEAMAKSGVPGTASGEKSIAASSGDRSIAASSGEKSKSASSGEKSKAASSGYGSTAASSGEKSIAASSGDRSIAASSGNGSKSASSGYGSTAASSGQKSTAASSGYGSIAASLGAGGKVKAGENGLLIACWWDNKSESYEGIVGKVGRDGIEKDTYYVIKNGKLIAA